MTAGAFDFIDDPFFDAPRPEDHTEVNQWGHPVDNWGYDTAGTLLDGQRRKMITGLSPSSMNSYSGCQTQWAFEKIYRLSSPTNAEAVAGTHTHRVLEVLMQQTPESRTEQFAFNLHNQILADLQAAYTRYAAATTVSERKRIGKDIAKSDPNLEHFTELVEVWDKWDRFASRATEALAGYFKMTDPTKVDVFAVELSGTIIWETPNGPVPVRGFIDRVDRLPEAHGGGLLILDYKTGRSPFRPKFGPKSNPANDPYQKQIAFYAAMAADLLDEQPTHGLLVYTWAGEVVKVRIDAEVIADIKAETAAIWNDINAKYPTDDWEVETSTLCGWCPFVKECPEGEVFFLDAVKSGKMKMHATARLLYDLPFKEKQAV